LFDGSNVWVTDGIANTLLKLDSGGAILQTVTVGMAPSIPVFDGSNIWVPNNNSDSVSVVRASSGALLATLTGNGLNDPTPPAFDGQRILVTNVGSPLVSLWKSAAFGVIGNFSIGAATYNACSDGISFWLTAVVGNKIVRF